MIRRSMVIIAMLLLLANVTMALAITKKSSQNNTLDIKVLQNQLSQLKSQIKLKDKTINQLKEVHDTLSKKNSELTDSVAAHNKALEEYNKNKPPITIIRGYAVQKVPVIKGIYVNGVEALQVPKDGEFIINTWTYMSVVGNDPKDYYISIDNLKYIFNVKTSWDVTKRILYFDDEE
jgi:hypothetical protein